MYKLEVVFFTCVLPKIVTLTLRDDKNFWSGIPWWCRGVILCLWYAELLSFRYNSRVPRLVYLNPDCMLFSNKYNTPITVCAIRHDLNNWNKRCWKCVGKTLLKREGKGLQKWVRDDLFLDRFLVLLEWVGSGLVGEKWCFNFGCNLLWYLLAITLF